jgi:hypothetical protein
MTSPPHPRLFDGPLARRLSGLAPDATLGHIQLGWYGLYPNRTRPGGAVLHCDAGGFCTAWYTPSTDRLNAAWAEVLGACAGLALLG